MLQSDARRRRSITERLLHSLEFNVRAHRFHFCTENMSNFKIQQLSCRLWAGALLLAVSFNALADDVSANVTPTAFPGLGQAKAEIAKLTNDIVTIEAKYEASLANSRKLLNQRYAEKLEALTLEQSDKFESPTEFNARIKKSRVELVENRDAALAELNVTKTPEKDIAPLKARIKLLSEHEYIVDSEAIHAVLGEYDSKKHQLSIKLSSINSNLDLKLEGAIPLPDSAVAAFQNQWHAGLIRPEARVSIEGNPVSLSLVNDADHVRWFEIKSLFYSLSSLKTLSPDILNSLFSVGRAFKDCPDCPYMIVLPAGSFNMGSIGGADDAQPIHRVTIGLPFAMGKTEVTQGEWKAVMGNNPGNFKNCGDSCPVEQVSWNDANDFIQKLNIKTGRQYRLPSEAEWEYACRAGGQQKYCGSDKVSEVAWYYANSGEHPHPVAAKQANHWGLRDMSGNLWEWVEDSYHANFVGAPVDGTAWQGDGAQRVIRGGAWNLISELVSANARSGATPVLRDYYYGFRVARMLP